jgi:hypothetical protein
MTATAPIPGLYRHYKGQPYRVLGTARHSETMEPLVVYQALYGEHGLWVRPSAMFMESVSVDGRLQPRFALEQADSKQADLNSADSAVGARPSTGNPS